MKQKKSMNLQKYLAIDQASLFYAFSKKYIKDLVQYKNKMKQNDENDENVMGPWVKLHQNMNRNPK